MLPILALSFQLIALLVIRRLQRESLASHLKTDYLKSRCARLETMYDAAINQYNQASLDIVSLRAELKRKHRRVPRI